MAAKPIIDLLPLVRDIAGIDDRTHIFQEAGYVEAYNDGKNTWIVALDPLAIAWYRQQAR